MKFSVKMGINTKTLPTKLADIFRSNFNYGCIIYAEEKMHPKLDFVNFANTNFFWIYGVTELPK